MAIYFETDNPQKLLGEFKKAIKDGKITTWSYDKDGDFYHTPEQWKNTAWLRPKIENSILALYIIRPKNINITSLAYAVYHGRFIEAMLVHCDTFFSRGIVSSFPEGNDDVSQE